MRLRTPVAVVFSTAIVLMATAPLALAQVNWAWQNMVVPPGAPGDWDSNRHQVGDVVFDGTTYHMFLLGGQTWLPWDSPWHVGHWTWNALTQNWDEDTEHNPVLSPEPGQWDALTIYSVAVIYDSDEERFKMWYGAAAAYPGESRAGYATSPDGSHWEKYEFNPLPGLEPGLPGDWDDAGVNPSSVLFDGSEYRVWYHAVKAGGFDWGTWRLGTATSPDGITWTKHPEPVLVGSLPWEDNLLYFPEVISYGGGYAMWYNGVVWGLESYIGYAVSPDGIHWGRWPSNPILSPLPGDIVIEALRVIVEGDTIHGWVNTDNDVWYVTSSPLEVVFFDTFETGDTAIWSSVVP